MQKRNFILLIIVLIIIIGIIFGIFYFFKPASPTGEDTTGTNFFSQFNPFGTSKPTPPVVTPPTDISGYQPPAPEEKIKLKKVSSVPIAGFTVFSKERLKEIPVAPITEQNTTTSGGTPGGGAPGSPVGTQTTGTKTTTTKNTKPVAPLTEFMPALRYVDRITGNIYQTFADKIEERKFTTMLIPKVYEAFFGKNGESIIMRYLKEDGRTIQTFVGNLPKEILGADTTENNLIKGSFLPENITDLSLSADKGSIFYLFTVGESMLGTILDLTTNKKTQVFDSAFTEWSSFWPNNKIITLTTKPSAQVSGYVYKIDLTGGKNLTKIMGNINGLTTQTSPDGKAILYTDNSLVLNVYHTDTNTSESLGVQTMPEKCVWNKTSDFIYCAVPKTIDFGSYPDTWYQGEVSFSDQIWKIEAKTGKGNILVDPIAVKGGEDIDGIKLGLEDGENYLFFVNKKDSFLWELELK